MMYMITGCIIIVDQSYISSCLEDRRSITWVDMSWCCFGAPLVTEEDLFDSQQDPGSKKCFYNVNFLHTYCYNNNIWVAFREEYIGNISFIYKAPIICFFFADATEYMWGGILLMVIISIIATIVAVSS